MSDDSGWYMRPLIRRLDLPNNTLDDPAVLEPAQLGFVAPKLAELAGFLRLLVGGGRSMVDEPEGSFGAVDEADVHGGDAWGRRLGDGPDAGWGVEDCDGSNTVAETSPKDLGDCGK